MFKADDNKIIKISNKVNRIVVNSSRNLIYMPNIGAIAEPIFLIVNTKKAFNYL